MLESTLFTISYSPESNYWIHLFLNFKKTCVTTDYSILVVGINTGYLFLAVDCIIWLVLVPLLVVRLPSHICLSTDLLDC